MPAVSFVTWKTCVSASEPSSLARYSKDGAGYAVLSYVPPRTPSAVDIASFISTSAVVDGVWTVENQNTAIRRNGCEY